jgi:hypothetical protein
VTTPPRTIEINGTHYPGPSMEDLSFDEMEVAVSLGCPAHADGDTEVDIKDIRWLRALVVIALERAKEDAGLVGEIRVNDVKFHGYPELNGGPPPNRAARRANGAADAKKPRKPGVGANPPGSSGHPPTDTSST